MTNLFSLKNKTAIVTGGTGVLGSEMVLALAEAGASVGVLGRRQQQADEVVQQVRERGGQAISLPADVLEVDSLEAALKTMLAEFGTIDILVNAAGGNQPGATIAPNQTIFDLQIPDLQKVIDLNLMGTILPSQVFGKVMADQKSGVIVNISSMAAYQAITRVMGYSVAKSAVEGYTRWLAVEMAQKFGEGIRVNAIAPGFFLADQNRRLLTNEDGSLTERGQQIINNTPFGRFGEPNELAGTLIWLCSDASRFVTGISVPVDGALTVTVGFEIWFNCSMLNC